MPVLIALAIVAVVAIYLHLNRKNGLALPPGDGRKPLFSTSPCRWREDKRRNVSTNTRWICTKCQVDAYTWDGKPPVDCKRAFRPTQL